MFLVFTKNMKTIEFAGMPKSGKTTQIEIIESRLKHLEDKYVRVIYEGARVCPLEKDNRFYYNAWSFHNTLNKTLEATLANPNYLLIDRGVYDHIAYTNALFEAGKITSSQSRKQKEYYLEFIGLEDSTLVFLVSPEEALEREHKQNLNSGSVMNPEFLAYLHEAYKNLIPEITKNYLVVEGSKPINENINSIYDFIRTL